jgi:hypothetical protein
MLEYGNNSFNVYVGLLGSRRVFWSWRKAVTNSTVFLNFCELHELEIASNAFRMKILQHLLTPRSRVLLEKLTGSKLVKKYSTFYGT